MSRGHEEERTPIFVMLKKDLDDWYLEDPLYNRKLRLLKQAA
jgi:hypothetical protein